MNKLKRCRYGTMVYQPNDTYIGRALELYGEYSEGEVALFRRLVRPGNWVLDIGANIGAHTIPLARFAGTGSRVIAFEPQRMLFYCLCANVALNNLSNVICHQAAAGEAERMLSVPELNYDAEYNFGRLDLTREYPAEAGYSVPVTPIDSLHLRSCHFIKIDVEGMEKNVLEGAVQTIRTHRPILYVEDDREEKSAGLRGYLDFLEYTVYQHRPFYFNPANMAGVQENIFPNEASFNLFAHPRELPAPIDTQAFQMHQVG